MSTSAGASAEAGFVEHRYERRAAAVLFARIRDPDREPLALASRVGGAAGLLENRDGAGVRAAAGLEQDLIRDEHVVGQRLLRLFCLAGFGEAPRDRPYPPPDNPRIPTRTLHPRAAPVSRRADSDPLKVSTAVTITPGYVRQCQALRSVRLANDQTSVSSEASVVSLNGCCSFRTNRKP